MEETAREPTVNPLEIFSDDVDATTERSGKHSLSRYQKCRILCSRESSATVTLVFFVGISQFFIFHQYGGFHFLKRDVVLVFLFTGIFSWLLVLYFVYCTCMVTCTKTKEVEEDKNLNEVNNRNKKMGKIVALYKSIKSRYNDIFDVNGKYYLTKMYTAEFLEHAQQVYSLTHFYMCWMPISLSSILCIGLSIELLMNIFATNSLGSQDVRARLILLDIFTDFFCIGLPLLYNWLQFRLPMNVLEVIWIVIYPIFSTLLKLREIWEENFRVDLQRIDKNNTKGSTKSSVRRRSSILNLSENKEVHRVQLSHFPRCVRRLFVLINICFILFFVATVIIQIATMPSTEHCKNQFQDQIWQGCEVEVPFCQHPFLPKCDCAVIQLANYTGNELPGSFSDMRSLMLIAISDSELKRLPDDFGESHHRLVAMHVQRNKLKTLPESLGKLSSLLNLRINNNELSQLPESIGQLENIATFHAYNNQLESLPKSLGNLKNLPSLYAWNNSLTELPDNIGEMRSLRIADFRHNHLTHLPASISKWVNVQDFYLAGNPLCLNLDLPNNLQLVRGLCDRQCSADCPKGWINDAECDDSDYSYTFPGSYAKKGLGCNTDACGYDGEDCKQFTPQD